MSPRTRKILTRDGAGKLAILEEPVAPLKPGQVLVDVETSLISPGTELGGVKRARENPSDSPPRTFGYANAGVVIEQGEGCEDIPLGTRVACMGGGYAEHASYACVPRNMAIPMPDGVTFDQAAFCTLAATSLNAIRRAELQLGEFLAVVGLGVVGQTACQWGRLVGCHVIALDMLPMRLEKAREAGVHLTVNVAEEDPIEISKKFTRGYGIDAGIMAFGGDATDAFETVYRMMHPAPDTHRMGRIVLISGTVTHRFGASLGNVDVRCAARTGPGYHDEAWEHGDDYARVLVPFTTKRNLEECLYFLDTGGLMVDHLITHRVPIDEAPEACEVLIQHPNEALGVAIKP